MRFLVHPPDRLNEWPDLRRAYLSGVDGRVFPTRVEAEDGVLACRRYSSESAKLHVAWPVEGFGRPVVTSASLCERDEPYLLPVELARGKIGQIRDQVAAWELAGMTIPDAFLPLHKEAHRLFARSAASQQNPAEATRLAEQALTKAFSAAELISRSYTEQRLTVRRRKAAGLPAALGCCLGHAEPQESWEPLFSQAFNSAILPIEWRMVEPAEGEYHWEVYDRQIEWCNHHRLLPIAGPLLDLTPGGLPEWLRQWQHDLLNMQSFVCDFVETAITRYVGNVRRWEVAAGANSGGGLGLNEENCLSLTARTLEVAGQIDQENQLMIRIDQPWGGYQARGHHRLAPMQFVDALLRSGAPVQGINIEISVGYRPRGSLPRDLLEFSRLIDLWNLLGLPLHVTLAFPSGRDADENAENDVQVEDNGWREPWSETAQAEWVEHFLPLLMAKQMVVGIYWTHFSDRAPHRFPHAGLVRPDGRPKPALKKIIQHRRRHWTGEAAF